MFDLIAPLSSLRGIHPSFPDVKVPAAAIALLIATLATATAQSARQVMFRTLCLEHSGKVHEVTMPGSKNPAESVTVPLYTADLSPVIEGTFTGGEAVFYSAEKDAEGKPVAAARGPLAKSSRQLFVFVPASGAGKPAYEIKAYDDDTTSFKMGSVRAINLSPVPVRFVVSGTASPQIPSSKHAQFAHPSKVDEFNMFPVSVEFLSGDGKWVTGQSASWKATPRRRDIVVTLVNSKFKQPEVRMYSDIPPWLDAQP